MFIKYAVVGGVATFAHYTLLIALVEWLSMPAPYAAALGALLGALVAYLGNRRYTFVHTTQEHSTAVPRFLFVALLGALANGSIVWWGVELLHLHYLFAQIIATILVLSLTFVLNRSWTFG